MSSENDHHDGASEARRGAVRVILIDDHPVVRAGLKSVIDASGEIDVIGDVATGEQGLTMARDLRPDVVLCDLRLGEGMDGIATTAALRALPAPPAVLILTTFDRDADVLGAIQAGAAGYLLKDVDPSTIVEAILAASRGGTHLSPELTSRLLKSMRQSAPKLTSRERDVLALLATGASNKDMAKQLFVSEATVKSHLVHIFTKLGVDTRTRAIHVARESGLL